MSYSLDDKIIKYLADRGVKGATVHEGTITAGKVSKTINGVVTKAKLDAIIEEYKATDHAA
jgi:PII-like signaling protein